MQNESGMKIDDARTCLRDDGAKFARWCEATGVVCKSKDATFDDLLLCLTRHGLPAEMAACALYTKTKRFRKDDTICSFVLDAEDWRQYLTEKNFMK
jgi:hypothetical protein